MTVSLFNILVYLRNFRKKRAFLRAQKVSGKRVKRIGDSNVFLKTKFPIPAAMRGNIRSLFRLHCILDVCLNPIHKQIRFHQICTSRNVDFVSDSEPIQMIVFSILFVYGFILYQLWWFITFSVNKIRLSRNQSHVWNNILETKKWHQRILKFHWTMMNKMVNIYPQSTVMIFGSDGDVIRFLFHVLIKKKND